MRQATRAPTLTIAAGLGALCTLLLALPRAWAQLPLEPSGLRGGRHVASAGPLSSAPRAVLGLGYAYTEGVLDGSDRHHRAFSELGAAYAPWPQLQLALDFDARYDAHQSDVSGEDRGGAFGTGLTSRHSLQLHDALWLAAQARVRFPASRSARSGLRAASPELSLLGTYLLLGGASELSLEVGYRFERSDRGVSAPETLSPADRLAASFSRYDAVLLGALYALPLGPVTASLEWSWDQAVGGAAPPALSSPMRVRLGAQLRLGKRCVPGVELGVSPSDRPSLERGARIEPRLWAALQLGVVFEPAVRSRPAPAPTPPAPSPPEPALVDLRVSDPVGAPVAGAQVSLRRAGGEAQRLTTDGEGTVALTLAADQAHRLTIASEGFTPYEDELYGQPGRHPLAVTLSRALPEGQIKGKVRGLRGGAPVRARIRVEPLGISAETDAEGDFVLDVPPGQYTLEISADGFEPQQRDAQVERLGVTILVVDLRRAAK